jgi:hypothetical protein
MRPLFLFVVALLAASFFSPSAASGSEGLALDAVRAEQLDIRDDALAKRGAYGDLSNAERSRLLSQQDRLLGLIEGKQSMDELSEPDRIKVLNQLETIKATTRKAEAGHAMANRAEEERMVCENVATIGSNRKERVCKTVGQRREEMRQAGDALNRRKNCTGCME